MSQAPHSPMKQDQDGTWTKMTLFWKLPLSQTFHTDDICSFRAVCVSE